MFSVAKPFLLPHTVIQITDLLCSLCYTCLVMLPTDDYANDRRLLSYHVDITPFWRTRAVHSVAPRAPYAARKTPSLSAVTLRLANAKRGSQLSNVPTILTRKFTVWHPRSLSKSSHMYK